MAAASKPSAVASSGRGGRPHLHDRGCWCATTLAAERKGLSEPPVGERLTSRRPVFLFARKVPQAPADTRNKKKASNPSCTLRTLSMSASAGSHLPARAQVSCVMCPLDMSHASEQSPMATIALH